MKGGTTSLLEDRTGSRVSELIKPSVPGLMVSRHCTTNHVRASLQAGTKTLMELHATIGFHDETTFEKLDWMANPRLGPLEETLDTYGS